MKWKPLIIFKCLFLICLFSVPLFYTAPKTYAQTATQSAETDNSESTIWDWLFAFFFRISRYFTKEFDIDSQTVYDPTAFTNYEQKEKDITFRAFNDTNRIYNKGAYLNDVIKGEYEDRTLAYNCDNKCFDISKKPSNSNCENIKISTLAYYYYKKGIQVLYDKNDPEHTIGYPSNINSYNYHLVPDDNCYVTLYDGLAIVPQGDYGGVSNAAPVSSKQLNNNLRTIQPQGDQDTDPKPSFWDSFLNFLGIIDLAARDNEKQEKRMLQDFIPDNAKLTSTENEALRKKYNRYMYPDSWQNSPPDRGDQSNDPNGGGHKKGLSQYGAQGRALAGQNASQILQAYYGTNTRIDTLPELFTAKIQITPSMDILEFEGNYMLGIAEMPDSWHLEALKAQAIAARTYAYVRTQHLTKPICIDTYCQVYNPKHVTSAPHWKEAVEATRGQILVDSTTGQPFLTMYCAWHGGSSVVYSDSGHSTVSTDETGYEQSAGAPY
jgi:hypothetical protein